MTLDLAKKSQGTNHQPFTWCHSQEGIGQAIWWKQFHVTLRPDSFRQVEKAVRVRGSKDMDVVKKYDQSFLKDPGAPLNCLGIW